MHLQWIEPALPVFTGHPYFDEARKIVGAPPRSWPQYDSLYGDLIMTAVLAMVEDKSPIEAVRRFRTFKRHDFIVLAHFRDHETLCDVIDKQHGAGEWQRFSGLATRAHTLDSPA